MYLHYKLVFYVIKMNNGYQYNLIYDCYFGVLKSVIYTKEYLSAWMLTLYFLLRGSFKQIL